MRLLGSRALFAAREKQHQSYRDENGKRGTKHQMRQWGHSGLLAVIRDPEPCVGQLNGTGSTKVRRAEWPRRRSPPLRTILRASMPAGGMSKPGTSPIGVVDSLGIESGFLVAGSAGRTYWRPAAGQSKFLRSIPRCNRCTEVICSDGSNCSTTIYFHE
jgi:hypothetical protein